MADIMVDMGTSVTGDGLGDDYAGDVKCTGMRHGIDLMVLQKGTSTGESPTRIEGSSVHSDFQLVKEFDKASPQLRAACAASTALGNVIVKRRGSGGAVVETVTLGNCKIASVSMHTPVLATRGGLEETLREIVDLEYDSITWKIADGAIERAYSTV